MSLRWRSNGTLLCAAKSLAEADDTYIDDRLHYFLADILQVIDPDEEEDINGIWHWVAEEDQILTALAFEEDNI